jgi:uncharacterized protein YoxC
VDLAEYVGILAGLGVLVGIQSFWFSRALGRVESSVDRVEASLDGLKAESHADMATHTAVIADLRERVARIES